MELIFPPEKTGITWKTKTKEKPFNQGEVRTLEGKYSQIEESNIYEQFRILPLPNSQLIDWFSRINPPIAK